MSNRHQNQFFSTSQNCLQIRTMRCTNSTFISNYIEQCHAIQPTAIVSFVVDSVNQIIHTIQVFPPKKLYERNINDLLENMKMILRANLT